jgi:hypothetical protein
LWWWTTAWWWLSSRLVLWWWMEMQLERKCHWQAIPCSPVVQFAMILSFCNYWKSLPIQPRIKPNCDIDNNLSSENLPICAIRVGLGSLAKEVSLLEYS